MGRCSTIGGGGATRTTTWAKAALVPSSAVAAAASKNFFIGRSPFLFEASYYIPAKHGLPPKVANICAEAILIRLVATTCIHNIVRPLRQPGASVHGQSSSNMSGGSCPCTRHCLRWKIDPGTRACVVSGCNSAGEWCRRASARSPRLPQSKPRALFAFGCEEGLEKTLGIVVRYTGAAVGHLEQRTRAAEFLWRCGFKSDPNFARRTSRFDCINKNVGHNLAKLGGNPFTVQRSRNSLFT